MIRIHLLGGESVDTTRHTYEQALEAMSNDEGMEVGGVDDFDGDPGFDPDSDDLDTTRPVRTIFPAAVASIERVR